MVTFAYKIVKIDWLKYKIFSYYSLVIFDHFTFTVQLRRSETEKNISDNLFSSVLSQFKKYHPSGHLK